MSQNSNCTLWSKCFESLTPKHTKLLFFLFFFKHWLLMGQYKPCAHFGGNPLFHSNGQTGEDEQWKLSAYLFHLLVLVWLGVLKRHFIQHFQTCQHQKAKQNKQTFFTYHCLPVYFSEKGVCSRVCVHVLCCPIICVPVLCCPIVCVPVLCCPIICVPVLCCPIICVPVLCCPIICVHVLCCPIICVHVLCCPIICVPVLCCPVRNRHSVWPFVLPC